MRTEVGDLYLEQYRVTISDDPDLRVIIYVRNPAATAWTGCGDLRRMPQLIH